jgi:hypothetical protein
MRNINHHLRFQVSLKNFIQSIEMYEKDYNLVDYKIMKFESVYQKRNRYIIHTISQEH